MSLHEKLETRTAQLAVFVACILIVIKVWAFLQTRSIAILGSLVDSILDVFVSLINFFALKIALEPADQDHRFGHTSVEDIAGLAQSAFICASAGAVLLQALYRLLHVEPVAAPEQGVWAMVICTVLTFLLVLWQRRAIRLTDSVILKADSLHYLGDLAANLMTLSVVMAASFEGLAGLDPVIGIVLSLMIVKGAVEIGVQSYHNLMDRELSADARQMIISLIFQDDRILGYHHLKTRSSGRKIFIQLHIDLPAHYRLLEAHAISDALEQRLLASFENAEVIVHQDPLDPSRQLGLSREAFD